MIFSYSCLLAWKQCVYCLKSIYDNFIIISDAVTSRYCSDHCLNLVSNQIFRMNAKLISYLIFAWLCILKLIGGCWVVSGICYGSGVADWLFCAVWKLRPLSPSLSNPHYCPSCLGDIQNYSGTGFFLFCSVNTPLADQESHLECWYLYLLCMFLYPL